MITPCTIYAVITILLSMVDALRIKANWGKEENITHDLSYKLAGALGGLTIGWYWVKTGMYFNWWFLLWILLVSIAFVGIRLAIYDPLLNWLRILMKTNPTGRIDYVSTRTTSEVDQRSEKVAFWWKRVLGIAGWGAMFLLYKIIFKV